MRVKMRDRWQKCRR